MRTAPTESASAQGSLLSRVQRLPLWVTMPAIVAVYVVAAKLGLSMAFVAEQVTVVWPPVGIALAALLLLGARMAPAIFVGALVANALTSAPLAVAAGIATGNTLEALGAFWILRRGGVDSELTRLRDVLLLITGAALASTTVSATIGVTSLCVGGVQPWTAFGRLWWVWWLGDCVGDLIVAPLLLVWMSAPQPRWQRDRVLEAAGLLAGVVAVTISVFVGPLGLWREGYPLHYVTFPFVIAAALRFGQRGATSTTLIVSCLAISSTVNGFGPFAAGSVGERLMMVQLYMAVVAVTALLLAAAISERNTEARGRAADYAQLAASEHRLRLALEAERPARCDGPSSSRPCLALRRASSAARSRHSRRSSIPMIAPPSWSRSRAPSSSAPATTSSFACCSPAARCAGCRARGRCSRTHAGVRSACSASAWTSASASASRASCAGARTSSPTPIVARTSSWRCWRTSCATRSRR
ncbi:MAG: hypothetical protein E6J72_20690 [Deltaproteobacteria bacterium]|nr:MAG: hypothetical protein E6J72_20690 [Deltaproteobacteria bacterium]